MGTIDRLKYHLIDRMPDRLYIPFWYFRMRKRFLNLKNPKTFYEKLQWVKLYGHLERYAPYVDKYEVRTYVAGILGDEYLVPLIGCWKDFETIPFDKLPERFVLKSTSGSGSNYICRDKSSLDKSQLKRTVQEWLDEDFYRVHREAQYRDIKPRIVCEQYIEGEHGDLRDYKILCFSGKPRVIEVHANRFGDHTADLYDVAWHNLHWKTGTPSSNNDIARPGNLNKMLAVAEKLARPFPFTRVDLYSVRGKIYFGELTFTPGDLTTYNGKPDHELGRMYDLSGYLKEAS